MSARACQLRIVQRMTAPSPFLAMVPPGFSMTANVGMNGEWKFAAYAKQPVHNGESWHSIRFERGVDTARPPQTEPCYSRGPIEYQKRRNRIRRKLNTLRAPRIRFWLASRFKRTGDQTNPGSHVASQDATGRMSIPRMKSPTKAHEARNNPDILTPRAAPRNANIA